VSGEGIGPAVESARLAAEAVLADTADSPARYGHSLATRFGTGELGLLGRVAEHLPRRWIDAALRVICRTSPLRRRLVFEGAFGMG
jgi:flavin-dependent dehydrogenase